MIRFITLLMVCALAAPPRGGPHVPATPARPTPPKPVAPRVPWSGANEAQIKAAPCRASLPGDKEVDAYLASVAGEKPSRDATVQGVQLKGESPRLIEAFERLVTKLDKWLRVDAKANPIAALAGINPECERVTCAVQKIFGATGPKLLYLNLRYGFNASQFAFEESAALDAASFDRLFAAIGDYPPMTFPVNPNKQMTKSTVSPDASTIANSRITFFAKWFSNKSNADREGTALHELAHYLAREKGLDETPEWLAMSDWERKEKDGKATWSAKNDAAICSMYGWTNPREDFAESAMCYRYQPALLKKISPAKYQYLKEMVFQGLEYTGAAACDATKSYGTAIRDIADKKAAALKSEDLAKLVSGACEKDSGAALDRCLRRAGARALHIDALSSITPPPKYLEMLKKNFQLSIPSTATLIPEAAVKGVIEARAK